MRHIDSAHLTTRGRSREVIRLRKVLSAALAIGTVIGALALGAAPASAEVNTQSVTTVRYGPFTIPGGTMDMPGMIENQLRFGVAKPCAGCYITSMAPNLTFADGTTANVWDGVMLHHTVLSSAFRSDPTCGGNLLGLIGQRFFASGNERTVVEVPAGYGYYVGWFDSWNMIVDLMNHSMDAQTVYIDITYTWTRTTQTRVTPVWLDVDQCGDSEYAVPAGLSDTHWDWTVNVPGKIVGIGGHIHDGGVRIEATNETTGESICDSVASYMDHMDMRHVMSMSKCVADPVAVIERGQTVRVHSVYDTMAPLDDAMGIMIAFIA